MQDARDTFFVNLRDRVAAGNAARTVVVRGVVRPAVVVVENELPAAAADGLSLVDTFCLRWTGVQVDGRGTRPLAAMLCEIRYATDGTVGNAGMDRGRMLAAMDAELLTALGTAPRRVQKSTFVSGTATALETAVFWGDVKFEAVAAKGERLERVATVEVYSYGESGER